jgi:hypothetical protein
MPKHLDGLHLAKIRKGFYDVDILIHGCLYIHYFEYGEFDIQCQEGIEEMMDVVCKAVSLYVSP